MAPAYEPPEDPHNDRLAGDHEPSRHRSARLGRSEDLLRCSGFTRRVVGGGGELVEPLLFALARERTY